MTFTTTIIRGESETGEIEVEVSYDYEEAFDGSWDEPGHLANVEVYSVVGPDGKEIELSESEMDRLRDECFEHVEDVILDHRIARWEASRD